MTLVAQVSAPKTALLTLLAVLAFAGNSVLNRAALADEATGWASFTAIRLASGAVMLAVLLGRRYGRDIVPAARDLPAILALFGYTMFFSLAYVQLTAATGALILFACVQITMLAIGTVRGHRPTPWQWSGVIVAFAGLCWLLLPGLASPPLLGSAAMGGAGIAWGLYSWLGRSAANPALATARNFIGTLPLAGMLMLFLAHGASGRNLLLAVASGAITSALGYVIWYAVLPRLSVVTAGAVQLSVPALAALGAVIFLSETVSARLVVATVLIFAGIVLTLKVRAR